MLYPALVYVLCIRLLGRLNWDAFLRDEPQASAIVPFLVMPVGELVEYVEVARPGNGYSDIERTLVFDEFRNGPSFQWLAQHESHVRILYQDILQAVQNQIAHPHLDFTFVLPVCLKPKCSLATLQDHAQSVVTCRATVFVSLCFFGLM